MNKSQETSTFTADKILELSRTSPIVHGFVTAWGVDRLTWEQCLIGCILALHSSNVALEKDAILQAEVSVNSRFIINKSHPDYEILKERGLL